MNISAVYETGNRTGRVRSFTHSFHFNHVHKILYMWNNCFVSYWVNNVMVVHSGHIVGQFSYQYIMTFRVTSEFKTVNKFLV